MKEASSQGTTRVDSELRGFRPYFRFCAEHPALYRIVRPAEFVSPEMLHYHYERLSADYVDALREASARGEIGPIDAEVTAWALTGMSEEREGQDKPVCVAELMFRFLDRPELNPMAG